MITQLDLFEDTQPLPTTLSPQTLDFLKSIARTPDVERQFIADMSRMWCPGAAPMPDALEPMSREEQAERAARHD